MIFCASGTSWGSLEEHEQMTSRELAYPDAIHITRDEFWRRRCVTCHSVSYPNVYIMIVNGQHYLKCSKCNIAMYSPHNI
jgi:hypothetical protein